jgi:hypothetical protein
MACLELVPEKRCRPSENFGDDLRFLQFDR